MKAIILAAGMGTRLGKYAVQLPKCMLTFQGKPLIEWQVNALRAAGIHDISVVRGFAKEKIALSGVKYYENSDYAETNMVATLMAARTELAQSGDGCLVCYADILYEARLIRTLLESKAAVGVLADDAWLPYWQSRLDNWRDDVESFQFDKTTDSIFEIGTPRCSIEQSPSRYIGLINFSPVGLAALTTAFDENKTRYWNDQRAWRRSKSFKQAYMTCMLQELIDRGIEVKAVHVARGWMEFDTAQDYEKANAWGAAGTLSRFLDLRALAEV